MQNTAITETTAKTTKAKAVGKAFSNLGLEVPAEVQQAVDFASQKPEVTRFYEQLNKFSTTDPKDFTKGLAALAQEYAGPMMYETSADFRGHVDRALTGRLDRAVIDHGDEMFASVTQAFNSVTADFNPIAYDFVRLSAGASAKEIDENSFGVLRTGRRCLSVMGQAWDAYTRLGTLTLRFEQDLGEPSSRFELICTLGTPEHFGQVQQAAQFLYEDSLHVDAARSTRDLQPFAALAVAGIPLDLKTPEDGQALRRQLQGVN